MDNLNIYHITNGENGSFRAESKGELMGQATYFHESAEVIIIDHVVVGKEFRGSDIGKKLVAAACDHARDNNLKVIPWCSFAKLMCERTPEFKDVLYK